jgi:hypothetical protein
MTVQQRRLGEAEMTYVPFLAVSAALDPALPARARLLSVTARAWGLSGPLPTPRQRAPGRSEITAPFAHSLRWAL